MQKTSLWQNRIAQLGLALVLLSLGVRYIVMVRPRAMEFDQICTLFMAKAPSWRAYIAGVPADSQPPFSHVAARLGLFLPLPEALGVHFVSVLAIAVAALCLFRLLQRRGAALAGVGSAALFTASRCVEYMFTVRPYAALLAVSALSIVVYDTYRTRRGTGRPATLLPLALVIVLAATIHALSLMYVLLPIVAGELLMWWQSRRFDKRLLIAVGLASTAFGYDFVLARQIHTHFMQFVPLSARTPGLPTLAKLYEVLTTPVERRWQALLLAAVVGGTLVLWRGKRRRADADRSGSRDLQFPVFAAGAIYLAGIVSFCMGAANHYFFTRYASPVYLCGPLLLGAALAAKPWRCFPAMPVAVSALLLWLPLPALRLFHKDAAHRSPREDFGAIFQHGYVIASPLAYPTLWWYATAQERAHLQMLTDPERYRTLTDGIPEAALQGFAAAGVLPFTMTPSRSYHPANELYLVSPVMSGDTWVPAALARHGFTCAPAVHFRSAAYALTRCVRSAAVTDRAPL